MPGFSITDITKSGATVASGGSLATISKGGIKGFLSQDGLGATFGADPTRVFVMDSGNVAVAGNPGDGVAAVMTIKDSRGMRPTDQGGVLSDLTGGLIAPTSGLLGAGASGPVLINTYQGSSRVNFQVQYALGNLTYITAFGDQLTQMTVTGIALVSQCPLASTSVGGVPVTVSTGTPGLTQIMTYYEKNKLKPNPKTGAYPQISISWFDGTTSFKGFIVGFTSGIQDPRNYAVPFQMELVGMYDKPSRGLLGDLVDLGLDEFGVSTDDIASGVSSIF